MYPEKDRQPFDVSSMIQMYVYVCSRQEQRKTKQNTEEEKNLAHTKQSAMTRDYIR